MSDPEQGSVTLRDILLPDLDIFFVQQQDPEANYMAAFTAENPADENAFIIKWAMILGDESFIKQTILYDKRVAGHIVRFEQLGEPEISYWIGREFWGKGIATRALALFLRLAEERPLFARVVKDNIASLRVLQKNGFTIIGEGKGYANARGQDVEEYILKLAAGSEALPAGDH
jgi:RimJ/RimL family protein N-acetyltransferase